jgi:hypothetical protein
MMDEFILIVDDHNGIYSAQAFTERVKFEDVTGITKESWDILRTGPDHKEYIQTWGDCLDNVKVQYNGEEHAIYQTDGIWIYPTRLQDAINWDEL